MEGIISTIISSIKNISIWSILDILVVSYIFYKAYKLIKETRAVNQGSCISIFINSNKLYLKFRYAIFYIK